MAHSVTSMTARRITCGDDRSVDSESRALPFTLRQGFFLLQADGEALRVQLTYAQLHPLAHSNWD